jgi:hypothetical protein
MESVEFLVQGEFDVRCTCVLDWFTSSEIAVQYRRVLKTNSIRRCLFMLLINLTN